MSKNRRRDGEPWRWALFGAGGQIAVIIMPALVLVVGIAIPFGWIGSEEGTYDLASVVTHPIVSALVFGVLGLVLWHCCHRVYHMLHDLQIEPPAFVMWLVYSIAVIAPIAGWIAVLLLGR
jgi:fumarate reductase subunit D